MNIEKLIIYGFGKHENMTIELGSKINLLYGHNESGKTTIQQFILHILFGFPQRNSTLLRYEPKSGGKYGGQIHIKDEKFGQCIVERVRGKSAGDVTVYFESGEVGGEEALSRLLRQYDRAAFEAIFSFSLLQLQDFDKMNEEELTRTLLASGTTGVDRLAQIETTMQKEMSTLFKKSGRKPELNQKLTSLKKLEESLQAERQKADQYAPTVKRLEEVENTLTRIQQQKEEDEQAIRRLTKEQQELPLQRKSAHLQERLNRLGSTQFPTNGIQRYESIKRQLDEVTASVVGLKKESERIQEQLQGQVNDDQHSAYIQLLDKESTWHRSLSTLHALEVEETELIEREQQLRARLGISSNDILINADVSIRKEEELYELLENLQGLHRDCEDLEKKQLELEELFNQTKERAQSIREPSVEEVEQAEQWPHVRQKLLEAKAFLSIQSQQKHQQQMMIVILAFFALLVVGYGLISRQYGVIGIAVIGVSAALFFMKGEKKSSRISEMEQLVAAYAGREEELEKLLEGVEKYEREKKMHKEQCENIDIDRQHLRVKSEELEQDIQQTEQALQRFLASYGIDGLPSATIIPELFRMIREIQEVMYTFKQTNEKRQQVEETIRTHHEEGERLIGQHVPQEALYEWIRKEEKHISEQLHQQQNAKEKKAQLEQEYREKEALIDILTQQITQLFQEAHVETEEAYYEADKKQGEKEQITQELSHLSTQLGNVQTVDLTLTDEQIENMIKERAKNIAELNKEQNALVEERAMLINQTNDLLSDEAASKLQQQFEIERADFIQLAKKWAAKQALATAIGQMMTDLKEQKFPAVLQQAEQLFSTLTSGRYRSMLMNEEGYFEVVSPTDMRFPIVELSQATKEQAYIALRLALANSMLETAPFPIIMDDPFVHFDRERRSHITKVMDQLCAHQFIYFTCHEEMKDHWQTARTINVSTIGTRQGAIH